MVTLNTGASSSVALNVFSKSPPSPTNLTSSFAEQLATSLEAFLNGGGNSSHFEIDVDAAQSQDSGVRQFIVTLRDPTVGLHAPTAPGDPSTAAPNAAAPLIGVQPAPVQPVAAPFVNPVMQMMGGSPSDTKVGAPLQLIPLPPTEADAYWSAQPPEVQKLRTLPYGAERAALAQQLSNQGHPIDYMIMVADHDPYVTMKMRQTAGYTWVPSLNQPNINILPGISMAGITPYDPNNPPVGSIKVSTDFAKGLEDTIPW